MQDEAAYPTRWEADVALSDGGTVHIRPVRPSDAALVEAFHNRQSRESIYFRYFSPMPRLSARELDRLTKVDYLDHLSLVAMLGGEIIGMAGYDRWTGPRRGRGGLHHRRRPPRTRPGHRAARVAGGGGA